MQPNSPHSSSLKKPKKKVEQKPKDDLIDADPNCDHHIITKWSGIECSKCGGWFCY